MRRLTFVLLLALPATLPAQSLLYRSPNIGGTWTGEGGVAHFNFLHRFYVAPSSGGNKVSNFPSFLIGVGVADKALIAVRYASNSLLVPPSVDYRPNEIELLARVAGAAGSKFRVAVTPAYNAAAESFDGEAALDYSAGRVTLGGAVRFFSRPFGISGGDAKLGVAGGATVRLSDYIALGADVAQMLDADTGIAWSAGISFLIPGSPHTFSLHASNATSTTLQGSTLDGLGKVLYGFEFTIPLHLNRFAPWFGKGGATAGAAAGGDAAATVRIAQLGFQTDTVFVTAGQSVRWVNDDDLVHTVTFRGGMRGSGDLAKGATFTMHFEQPGTYVYSCTPHPFMSGVVVVR